MIGAERQPSRKLFLLQIQPNCFFVQLAIGNLVHRKIICNTFFSPKLDHFPGCGRAMDAGNDHIKEYIHVILKNRKRETQSKVSYIMSHCIR